MTHISSRGPEFLMDLLISNIYYYLHLLTNNFEVIGILIMVYLSQFGID